MVIRLQLADLHPEARLIPPVGSLDRGLVYRWSFFAMTELKPAVFHWMRARREDTDQTEPSERYHAAAAVLEAALADRDWLLGAFSVADVICAGVPGSPIVPNSPKSPNGFALMSSGHAPAPPTSAPLAEPASDHPHRLSTRWSSPSDQRRQRPRRSC